MVRLVIEKITPNEYSTLVTHFSTFASDSTTNPCIYPFMKSPRRCCRNSFCSISFPIFYSNSRKNSKLIALKMWEMPRILTEKQKTTFKLRIMLCCLYCKSYICRRKIQPYSHIQPDGAARCSPTFVVWTKIMRLISNIKRCG